MDCAAEPIIGTDLADQLKKLDRMADIALEIGQALADQATGRGPQVLEGDITRGLDRVARALRLTLMLRARLKDEDKAPPKGGKEPLSDEDARKARVVRIVRRVAERDERLDPFQMGAVGSLARERLEHDDIYGKVMTQPVSDLVADICFDLGLRPDWSYLAAEAWAQEEIESGIVGEPLQDLLDAEAAETEGRDPAATEPDDPPDSEDASEAEPEPVRDRKARPPVPIPTYHEKVRRLAYDAQQAVQGRRSG